MSAESVFICYRRDDSGETAGRIFDRLAQELPEGTVFRDLDSIPLGVDFREHVRQKMECARVVLVLIGPEWLKIRDGQRQRRLENAADHVRVEVELALRTPGLRVIPILCRRATMPNTKDLPEPIRDLAFKNGQDVLPDPYFRSSMDHLLKQLRLILAEPPPKKEEPAQAAADVKPQPVPSPKPASEKAKTAAPATSADVAKAAAPLAEKKTAPAKDGAPQSAAGGAPAAGNPPVPAKKKTPKEIAKQAVLVVFVLAFYAALLWGAFVVVRFASGKLGEGITWVKTKFATPTPWPHLDLFPPKTPTPMKDWGLLDPKRVLTNPTPNPLFPPSGKSTSELMKELGVTGEKRTFSPTPTPSLSERLKLITQPTPTPAK